MGQIARDVNLRAYSYHGITLPDQDPKLQGRYKIHIPEFHHLLNQNEGIWCKNQVHQWRWTPSDDYMYGEYYPLQPGTKVLIKFYENDFHTGYIDRIISDQVIKTTPKVGCGLNPEATTDRDDIYMIYKTPKYHNLFLINEKTTDSSNGLDQYLIKNSIHLYYNYRRSTMILNEDGIHWFTMDNRGVTVEGNNSEWVNKNEKIYVHENRDIYIKGNHKHLCRSDGDSVIFGQSREYSKGQHSTISSSKISLDAPKVLINCGSSKMAKMAKVNKGEDEIIVQKKIDTRVVSHLNQDDTYYGIPSQEIVGGVPPMPKYVGDKELSKLSKGMNDRHSSIGASQTGAEIIVPPQYPQG